METSGQDESDVLHPSHDGGGFGFPWTGILTKIIREVAVKIDSSSVGPVIVQSSCLAIFFNLTLLSELSQPQVC
jgi:hypothetical protein